MDCRADHRAKKGWSQLPKALKLDGNKRVSERTRRSQTPSRMRGFTGLCSAEQGFAEMLSLATNRKMYFSHFWKILYILYMSGVKHSILGTLKTRQEVILMRWMDGNIHIKISKINCIIAVLNALLLFIKLQKKNIYIYIYIYSESAESWCEWVRSDLVFICRHSQLTYMLLVSHLMWKEHRRCFVKSIILFATILHHSGPRRSLWHSLN